MLPVLAAAQDAQLKLPSFADLKDKAVNSVDITLGSSVLGFMGWMMHGDDKDAVELKKTIHGTEVGTDPQLSVHFGLRLLAGRRGRCMIATDRTRLEPVDQGARSTQERGCGYLHRARQADHQGTGVIAANRREFTILNIVGAVALEQVAKLRETFGAQGAGM